jgi:hypothetical protein
VANLKQYSFKDIFAIVRNFIRSKYVSIVRPEKLSIEKLEAILVNWMINHPTGKTSGLISISEVVAWIVQLKAKNVIALDFDSDVTLQDMDGTFSDDDDGVQNDTDLSQCIIS